MIMICHALIYTCWLLRCERDLKIKIDLNLATFTFYTGSTGSTDGTKLGSLIKELSAGKFEDKADSEIVNAAKR